MKSQRSVRIPTPPSAQVGERIDAYVKTPAAARRPLELFSALVGDKPVAALSAEDVDRFATQMFDWPRDAGRIALFKDASPQEILARANRSRADPIVPGRFVATVRVFVTALIEKAELDPDFIQAFDRWIGAHARR